MSVLRVLSLGAGVQSSTLALLSAVGELEPLDFAVFADTGWEPPAVYEWLDHLETLLPFPVTRVQGGNLRDDLLRAAAGDGRVSNPPAFTSPNGQLRRSCTRDYKIRPVTRHLREIRAGRTVEQWFGISLDEVQRMKPVAEAWVVSRWPLIELEMDRAGCLRWMEEHGFGRPPKSACVGCPYRSTVSWRSIRSDPVAWTDAVSVDRAIRRGLPGVQGEVFLHVDRVPLDEADLSIPEDHGQLSLADGFGDECGGWCAT